MSFFKAYISAFKNAFNFRGRATRSEYWYFQLVMYILAIPCYIIVFISYVPALYEEFLQKLIENPAWLIIFSIYMIFIFIYALVALIPSLSLTVRRLHDVGKPWYYIFVSYIPCYIGTIWYLILMCTKGQAHDNEWGPDPKAVYYNPDDYSNGNPDNVYFD